jgi:hypothetical protein
MKYLLNVAGTPHFYAYQRNGYKQKYFIKETYGHREGLSNLYRRNEQPNKLREYRYYIPSPKAKVQRPAYALYKRDFMDWTKLLYQIIVPQSYDSNAADIKMLNKPHKATFELLELKTDGRYYEYLIRDCIKNNIVTWGYLSSITKIKEYLKENPFPEDALYSEQMFWEDYENKYGYISIVVEKRETAEFICDLCAALIIRHKISKGRYKNENQRI